MHTHELEKPYISFHERCFFAYFIFYWYANAYGLLKSTLEKNYIQFNYCYFFQIKFDRHNKIFKSILWYHFTITKLLSSIMKCFFFIWTWKKYQFGVNMTISKPLFTGDLSVSFGLFIHEGKNQQFIFFYRLMLKQINNSALSLFCLLFIHEMNWTETKLRVNKTARIRAKPWMFRLPAY